MPIFDHAGDYVAGAAGSVKALFVNPGSFLSPAPLVVALIIAGAAIALRRHKSGAQFNLQALLRALFPASVWKHVSTRHDAAIILINEGLLFFLTASAAMLVAPLAIGVAELAGAETRLLNPPSTNFWMLALFGLYFALAWDFMNTYAHYLKHKVPLLWEFHKVHHCAEVLTPLTALRRHPVEIIASSLITGSGMALAVIIWALVFGAPGKAHEVGGAVGLVYLWRLLGYNIRHSHVWISYGPFWNRFLMSPAHHQLHHSREPRHYDCNFGHIFTFWDRLFGTLYQPVEGEVFELGIEREENEKLRTLSALYFRPLKKAAERFAPQRRPLAAPPAE